MRRCKFAFWLTWGWVLIALALGASLGVVAAQSPNQVGLVVNLGNGNVLTRCVEFVETELSGYDVLEQSGLQVDVLRQGGMGGAVCAIEGVGCPVNNCFCECSGSTCTYWSYWYLSDGEWTYSSAGADAHTVSHGDVEGWNWGEEQSPPVVSFEQICAPPATETPVPTATPTDTPLPPPSVSFGAEPQTIVAGQCAELRWRVDYVEAVYLEGQGVGGHGSESVCPAQTETYELRVVSASGESRHQTTINVVQPSPTLNPTATLTLVPAATSTLAPQAPVQPTATESLGLTATPTVASISPTQSLAPSVTPTQTATPGPTSPPSTSTPTPTVTSTPTPRPVAALLRASPTATSALPARPQATPTSSSEVSGSGGERSEQTANLAMFGVLMAILLAVSAVVVLRRRH